MAHPTKTPHLSPARLRALRSCGRALARAVQGSGSAVALAVCTHNSRRSQLAQVYLALALAEAGVADVRVDSAGTEVTAVASGIVGVLRERGFDVDGDYTVGNPRLAVRGHGLALELWSKTLDEALTATDGAPVIAIMVCAAADDHCPYVPGAVYRARLPFDDPKRADHTPEAPAAYREAAEAIEAEMRVVAREAARAFSG